MNKFITIIVPCYNEQESIHFFYQAIQNVKPNLLKYSIDIELLFVNDGSKDQTLKIIKELAILDKTVKYISFSRNFGKEAAIFAGLENSKGHFVALMDADLQDPPELLEEMYVAIKNEGFDCIATKRSTRKGEPIIRSWFSRLFYRIMNKISDIEFVDGARDFRLMTRQMVDGIVSLKECNRFSKGIFSWVGFDVKWLAYENRERVAGTTKWSFWKLFKYSIDGIFEFSVVPLAISSISGVIISFLAFVGIIFIIIRTSLYGDPVSGWPSMVTIFAFIGGLQLLCLGIIGQYLAKTYLETKNRPKYLVKESKLDS